jgi:mRNA-degrading endonuclease toxin of MazEF toxin-antitoxin module
VGEVWWAQVPFEEKSGSKDRPALVVAAGKRQATVLMFTSADKRGREGFVPVDPRIWRSPRTSYLRLDRQITIPLTSMRRREGVADSRLMDEVTRSRA